MALNLSFKRPAEAAPQQNPAATIAAVQDDKNVLNTATTGADVPDEKSVLLANWKFFDMLSDEQVEKILALEEADVQLIAATTSVDDANELMDLMDIAPIVTQAEVQEESAPLLAALEAAENEDTISEEEAAQIVQATAVAAAALTTTAIGEAGPIIEKTMSPRPAPAPAPGPKKVPTYEAPSGAGKNREYVTNFLGLIDEFDTAEVGNVKVITNFVVNAVAAGESNYGQRIFVNTSVDVNGKPLPTDLKSRQLVRVTMKQDLTARKNIYFFEEVVGEVEEGFVIAEKTAMNFADFGSLNQWVLNQMKRTGIAITAANIQAVMRRHLVVPVPDSRLQSGIRLFVLPLTENLVQNIAAAQPKMLAAAKTTTPAIATATVSATAAAATTTNAPVPTTTTSTTATVAPTMNTTNNTNVNKNGKKNKKNRR